ncbi:MAG TPA: M48 family metalloprotease [Rubrivivax sp.]|nr:M48 family metalloprotease [Rubrivivax sp.]
MTRPRSPLHRLARTLMLLAAFALPVQGLHAQAQTPAAPLRLPALGESAAEDFSVSAERRLGDEIMAEIRRDPAYLDDPLLLEYLQSLWQPLVQAARARGDIDADTGSQFAWEAFLVRDKSVNAFALPGGFVGVHLGLIAMTHTRDQLASVLAHELTHVTQRHIARSITTQQRQTLLSVAGMILALLAASRADSPDLAQAAVMGGQAAALQGQLNFSRDMEREADRIGFALLDGANFDPAGMSTMFELMDRANRFNDSNAYPYLRSHPLTLERQSEARLRLHGAAPRAQADVNELHELMSARARVLMDTSVAALRRLQELPATRSAQAASALIAGKEAQDGAQEARPGEAPRLAALYTSALASSLLREHGVAAQRLRQARALLAAGPAPSTAAARALDLLDAELRLAADDALGALQRVTTLRERGPDAAHERPLLMLQGHATLLLPAGVREAALRDVTERLQSWVALHPQDAMGWLLLGNCAEAQGQRLRALRAQAEARLLIGDLTGAIDRLAAGRQLVQSGQAGKSGADFIEASIIEARWRELQARRRALIAERGGRVDEREWAGREQSRP